ncbi:hypothetical protein [Parasphingorhabdus halotolerans]|uniref:GspE/PulE/PilB domain-containing protein n=1 Tax=Parasphingorhabdus halotolerans TaxID=2725558 RepID=UPI0031B6002C
MTENFPEQSHPNRQTAGNAKPAVSIHPLLDLPYCYAREHGILFLSGDSERITVALHDGSDPLALLKIQRYLSMPLDLKKVDEASFEKLLQEHYAVMARSEENRGGSH